MLGAEHVVLFFLAFFDAKIVRKRKRTDGKHEFVYFIIFMIYTYSRSLKYNNT